jgi:copper(I)-binding protein
MLVLVLAGCSTPAPAGEVVTAGDLRISDVWVRAVQVAEPASGSDLSGAMDMSAVSGAYMTIANTSGTPDRLIAVTSSVAHVAELHTTSESGGVMQMRPVDAVEVPAHGEAQLKPGGTHAMLIGLMHSLEAGSTTTLTLTFERAGSVDVTAVVRVSR